MTSSLKQSELLTEAKKLLETKGWNQFSLARDKHGQSTFYDDTEACSYCAVGAVWAASKIPNAMHTSTPEYASVASTIQLLQSVIPGNAYTSSWNDVPGRTKEEVLTLFDTAIEKAKENER